MAPNQPDPENVALNIRMSRILRAKLDKYVSMLPKKADKRDNPSASSVLRSIIEREVGHVTLTAEEIAVVEAEKREAFLKQKKH
jgi:hypothetical protein